MCLYFPLPFLFLLRAVLDGGDNKRAFLAIKRKKRGGDKMQFVKAIVSDVRFAVAFTD